MLTVIPNAETLKDFCYIKLKKNTCLAKSNKSQNNWEEYLGSFLHHTVNYPTVERAKQTQKSERTAQWKNRQTKYDQDSHRNGHRWLPNIKNLFVSTNENFK